MAFLPASPRRSLAYQNVFSIECVLFMPLPASPRRSRAGGTNSKKYSVWYLYLVGKSEGTDFCLRKSQAQPFAETLKNRGKRDLLQRQKRPTIEAKETYYRGSAQPFAETLKKSVFKYQNVCSICPGSNSQKVSALVFRERGRGMGKNAQYEQEEEEDTCVRQGVSALVFRERGRGMGKNAQYE